MNIKFILTRSIPYCVITIGTEEYGLSQQYVFTLIKPSYMFQLCSHHQAYLQSLVELYKFNAYTMWDPSSEATGAPCGCSNCSYISMQRGYFITLRETEIFPCEGTVRSESRCALRLRYVDLVVSIEVAFEVCCCFTVFSC
jgi:hypothetical protein